MDYRDAQSQCGGRHGTEAFLLAGGRFPALAILRQQEQFNAGGVKLPFGIFPALGENRYQGWAVGAGLSYGYHWMLNRKWSLEFSLGVGYLYIDYKKYKCAQCGEAQKDAHRNYVGPTKAAINLIYVL